MLLHKRRLYAAVPPPEFKEGSLATYTQSQGQVEKGQSFQPAPMYQVQNSAQDSVQHDWTHELPAPEARNELPSSPHAGR